VLETVWQTETYRLNSVRDSITNRTYRLNSVRDSMTNRIYRLNSVRDSMTNGNLPTKYS